MPLMVIFTVDRPTEVSVRQDGIDVRQLAVDADVSYDEWVGLTEEQIIDRYIRPAVAALKQRDSLVDLYRWRLSNFEK
jgi:hypothetical protein